MRLQIKTLNQKSILVDIDDTKTVYDLKQELSSYPDVGVRPELQKLIYAGKILANGDELNACNIDPKKFLVVMVLKQPVEEGAGAPSGRGETATPEKQTATAAAPAAATAASPQQQQQEQQQQPASPAAEAAAQAIAQLTGRASEAAAARDGARDEMVQQIVGMGYPEAEVRRALAASFNNPERAVEYLIEGIPTDPSTPEGDGYDYSDDTANMSPFEIFRSDPMFRELRRAIQQHPDMIHDAIQRVSEANPALISLINDNQTEFFNMLLEASDEEGDEVEDEEEST